MALNKKNVALIEDVFGKIFPDVKIQKEDAKSDGGYENVYIEVADLGNWELQKLSRLLFLEIPNSKSIQALEKGKIRILFY